MDSERDSPLPSNIQTGGTPTHVDDVRIVLFFFFFLYTKKYCSRWFKIIDFKIEIENLNFEKSFLFILDKNKNFDQL